MSGYTGKLKIKEKEEYDVLDFSFSFSRGTDHKGRPSTRVTFGQMSMTIELANNSKLAATMINGQNVAIEKGTLIFTQAGEDPTMRTVIFKKGFITSYSESFSSFYGDTFSCHITITAAHVSINDIVKYNAEWPKADGENEEDEKG
ncbi:type VI secretion system tube protein TssD [Spirosoma fluviale]|uniref:Type VI secretion system needle protein Hcp n=1 Tax=Spirosoma fluviale TaxID=1597977 RepID=A0A286G484_9BACT|nr:type VI secretion system tube protein TssD [Spirosoma fluviale]SOD90036.1 hypothetical protein SAMN06269250_3277 [Spirosoma fluviale]